MDNFKLIAHYENGTVVEREHFGVAIGRAVPAFLKLVGDSAKAEWKALVKVEITPITPGGELKVTEPEKAGK